MIYITEERDITLNYINGSVRFKGYFKGKELIVTEIYE